MTDLKTTEPEHAEARLRHTLKLEALSQLAEGLAHDFNNFLTVIQGYSNLLLAEERLPPETRAAVTQIYHAGERAAGLTRQLLVFCGKQALRRQTLDLNEVVRDAALKLPGVAGGDIALHLDCATPLPPVSADADMIEQALLNLAANAREAMPKGGHLHLGTAPVVIDREAKGQHPESRPGDFVCLSVRDTGGGIAPEVRPRLFEPFSTTKKPGHGAGLGLAVVHGIVKQHEGWVEVESQPGAGTTFQVFLPALPQGAAAASPKPAGIGPARGTETILIVEDEESMRRLAVLVLQRCGYRVLEAASAIEALEVWERHQSRIELLLTDMVLSDDLTGAELAGKMRSEKPSLKVVYTSAYRQEMTDAIFQTKGPIHFLQKPCHPQKLTQTVRQVLDGTSAERKP